MEDFMLDVVVLLGAYTGGKHPTSAAREEIETFGYSVNYRKRTCSDGVSQQN